MSRAYARNQQQWSGELDELEDGSFDAGLVLLVAVTPPGLERTCEEIAYVCGCSRQSIWQIEDRALKKLQRRKPLLLKLIGDRL